MCGVMFVSVVLCLYVWCYVCMCGVVYICGVIFVCMVLYLYVRCRFCLCVCSYDRGFTSIYLHV